MTLKTKQTPAQYLKQRLEGYESINTQKCRDSLTQLLNEHEKMFDMLRDIADDNRSHGDLQTRAQSLLELKSLGEGPHVVDGEKVHTAGPFGTKEGATSWANCLPKQFTWTIETQGQRTLDFQALLKGTTK